MEMYSTRAKLTVFALESTFYWLMEFEVDVGFAGTTKCRIDSIFGRFNQRAMLLIAEHDDDVNANQLVTPSRYRVVPIRE